MKGDYPDLLELPDKLSVPHEQPLHAMRNESDEHFDQALRQVQR